MNTDRDKYLTEAMGISPRMEICTCDQVEPYFEMCCVAEDETAIDIDCSLYYEEGKTKLNCGYFKSVIVGDVPNFSTWQGFGKLWTWVQTQKWWDDFFLDHSISFYNPHKVWRRSQVKELINPDRFANAVYEFLKGRES